MICYERHSRGPPERRLELRGPARTSRAGRFQPNFWGWGRGFLC